MITIRSKTNIDGDSAIHFEFDGTSQDEIPKTWDGQPIEQNSIFHELDTGRDYYYDGQAWQKVGTGGESGDMELRYFTITGLPNNYVPLIPAYVAAQGKPLMMGMLVHEDYNEFFVPVLGGECSLFFGGIMDTDSMQFASGYDIDQENSTNITYSNQVVTITGDNAVLAFAGGSPT